MSVQYIYYFVKIHWVSNHKSAVVLHNETFRLQFDELFFIYFPKTPKRHSAGWKTYERNNK